MATNTNHTPITVCSHESAVAHAAHSGKRWVVYLEYSGYNGDNVSGQSNKFWELSGDGTSKVRARWGRIGTDGRSQAVDYYKGLERLSKKIDKGYEAALAA
jgi:predicted DNA-binding WGR domain protein